MNYFLVCLRNNKFTEKALNMLQRDILERCIQLDVSYLVSYRKRYLSPIFTPIQSKQSSSHSLSQCLHVSFHTGKVTFPP